jgi:hypothetical protein
MPLRSTPRPLEGKYVPESYYGPSDDRLTGAHPQTPPAPDGSAPGSSRPTRWTSITSSSKLPAWVRRGRTIIDLTMTLEIGWRRGNITWRPTTWGLRQMGLGGMKLVDLSDEDRRRLNLADDRMALKADHVGEYGEHAIAKRAGFKKGDIIVAVDGHDRRMTESQLIEYALWQKGRGDTMAVTVVRDGERNTLSYALP